MRRASSSILGRGKRAKSRYVFIICAWIISNLRKTDGTTLIPTEPLRGHRWKKNNVISFPRNHFLITKYVISFPRNHFLITKYVISFPRNHFVRTKYVISFPRNVIRHHEIYHIIIYYHIYISHIYHTYIYLSHIYISHIYIYHTYTYTHIFFISFIYTGTLHSAIGRFSMSSTFHILHWLHICQTHGDK